MQLVNVVTAPNEPIAEMWCEILKSEGVPAFTKLPGAGSPSIMAGAELDGCWVMVREEDVDRATAILQPLVSPKRPRRRR
jgi:Putative prokaryotic signal transducing protein